MSITLTQPVANPCSGGQSHRWTREDVERLYAAGFLKPDDRVELIAGEIIHKMTQNKPHIAAVWKTVHTLERAFGPGFTVTAQAPLALATDGLPEPDALVIAGGIEDSPDLPTQDDALLVVEVSDSTLAMDQGRKAAYYAESWIADYWIVNLVDRRLEVRRAPVAVPDTAFGFAYSDVKTYQPGESVAPLAAPLVSIAVDDLLPRLP